MNMLYLNLQDDWVEKRLHCYRNFVKKWGVLPNPAVINPLLFRV